MTSPVSAVARKSYSLKPSLLAIAIAQSFAMGNANGATISVNSLLDNGDGDNCTLREALGNANGSPISIDCATGDTGADTIVFDPALVLPAIITLAGSELTISEAVTITGPGAAQLAISGNNLSRVISIDDSDSGTSLTVNISEVTLTEGRTFATGFGPGSGAAIYNRENLTLSESIVSNSSAGSNGGGVSNYRGATALLINTTLVGNTATDSGGALFSYNSNSTLTGVTLSNNSGDSGGALVAFQPPIMGASDSVRITNSTLSGNTGVNRGGAIDTFNSTVSIINSTIANNESIIGAGVYIRSGELTLTNSLIGNNTGGMPLPVDCTINGGGSLTSVGNFIEDGTCNPAISGTFQATDLDLTLANNGGSTQTHALLTGSRAIDAGVQASCTADGITTDQTGMARPVDAEGDGAAVCDIGAFEYVDTTPPQPSLNNTLADIEFGGGTSLPINVNFLDENPLNLTTLGIANLSATPGATITAQSVVGTASGDRDVDVTYTLVPPGGSWDSADNGTITVSVEPNQVFDTASPVPNATQSAQVLATFDVTIAEIDVTGNAISIPSGDTTASVDDGTDFGDVAVNVDEARTFTITNTALGILNLTSAITVSGTSRFSVDQPAQTLLGAGESTTFGLTFNSSLSGQVNGTISFRTNDSDEDPYTFAVTANAVEPELDVTGNGTAIIDGDMSPTNETGTEFGLVTTGDSIVRTFVLTNSGGIELTVSDIMVSGEGFSVGALMPASPIAAGQTASVELTFAPTTEGRRTGTVTITSNDADENPYTFDVSGDSTAPDIDVVGNASSIVNGDATPNATDLTDFGDVAVGAQRTNTFSISNAGIGTINLSLPVTVSGAGFNITTQPDDFSLAGGESTSLSVTASPDVAGPLTGVVSISSDDPDENPFTFSVAVQGVTPEIDVTGNGQSIAAGDSTPDRVDGTEFGEVLAGTTAQQTFTVSNTGSQPLDVSSIVVTGEGFSLASAGSALLATGESAEIMVDFQSAAAGRFIGTLNLTSNDLDEGAYAIAIAGTGISPEIALSGNNVDILDGDTTPAGADGTNFGDVAVGGSVTQVFAINNTGSAPLMIDSVVSSFVRFEVGNVLPATVAVGESLDLEVTFRPVIEMPLSARLTIESNDLDEGTFTFDVAANGVDTNAPVIAANSGFSVLPGATVGTVVGQVQVSDANNDIPATGAFAIIAGNANGAFAISDDGTITVANTAALGPAALTVRVTDLAGLSDSAMITISLTGESVFSDGFESP